MSISELLWEYQGESDEDKVVTVLAEVRWLRDQLDEVQARLFLLDPIHRKAEAQSGEARSAGGREL